VVLVIAPSPASTPSTCIAGEDGVLIPSFSGSFLPTSHGWDGQGPAPGTADVMSNWGQGGSRNWRKIRQQVLERDRYECQLQYDGCIWAATEVHHRAGIAASGLARGAFDDEVSACMAVCQPCHRRVSARQSRAAQQQLNATRAARRKLPQLPHPGEP
jgi:hypothetical protein